MAKRGPPSSFKPEYCDLARKFCTLGATNADLGRMFDVTRRMIDYWMVDFPDFATAIRAGRAIADGNVAEKLHERAMGYSHPAVKIMKSGGRPLTVAYTRHYPPDTPACIFWLRNRRSQNWREKVEHEHRDAPGWVAELEAAGERARTLAARRSPGWRRCNARRCRIADTRSAIASSLMRPCSSLLFWVVRSA